MKKVLSIIIALIVVSGIFSYSLAAGLTNLDIIEKASETKNLENNQGVVSKKIVDYNSDTGEVTIELNLANSKSVTNNAKIDTEQEIFILIDASRSMNTHVDSERTRNDVVLDAATNMVNSLFSKYNTIKVGIVKFASYGEYADSDESNVEEDAKLMCELSNDVNTVTGAINRSPELGRGTDLEAALLIAKDNFTNDNSKKIIVILTDGVPTNAVNIEDVEDDGTIDFSEGSTSKAICDASKKQLIDISNQGVDMIAMLTGVDESYQPIAEYVFGTESKPTVGKYYNIADSDIETVINESILRDVSKIVEEGTMKNVKMVDYFPSDITDNFDFSYESKPNIGSISESIDSKEKSISWNIDQLKSGETAIVRYKLKLKDMNNEKLIDRVIATNEKVVLTYEVDKEYTVVLDSSPKIKLSKKDDSVSPNALAETGEFGYISGGIIIAEIVFIAYRRYKRIKF